MPPYVVLNMKSKSHVAWGGYLGKQFDPLVGSNVDRLFRLPSGFSMDRVRQRRTLSQ